jgi:hypothetical protein
MTRYRSRNNPYRFVTINDSGVVTQYESPVFEEIEDDLHHTSQLGKGGDVGGVLVQTTRSQTGGVPMLLFNRNTGQKLKTVQHAHKHSFSTADFPTTSPSSKAVLWAKGTQAIARCEPTNPVSSLATSLAELRREGLPSMFGSGLLREKAKIGRGAGNEYLNYQFGWAPLMSDLRSFGHSVQNSNKILTQYRRDSGKPIRRRYEFPIEESTSITQLGSTTPQPSLQTAYYESGYSSSENTKTRTRVTTKRTWFSGSFTYHLAVGSDAVNKFARWNQEADKLFGVSLTPEVVWNLTPWSWASDWFFNVGDVLHNVSAVLTDGLVMHYGYIMEQTSVSDVYVNQGTRYHTGGTSDLVQTFTTTSRRRYPANPFGFGLTNSDLSGRQLAIIAALGLTKT